MRHDQKQSARMSHEILQQFNRQVSTGEVYVSALQGLNFLSCLALLLLGVGSAVFKTCLPLCRFRDLRLDAS